ncbi:hypothetical protein LEP1GSC021_4755 [Leptospira noguchii str. 1993005606]|nr:hypothetical protein LEP1GSC021_4755 [Leptospira noguchii str. 1993005606]
MSILQLHLKLSHIHPDVNVLVYELGEEIFRLVRCLYEVIYRKRSLTDRNVIRHELAFEWGKIFSDGSFRIVSEGRLFFFHELAHGKPVAFRVGIRLCL